MRNRAYKRKWLTGDRGKWILIALLVFAFPVGLYLMWDEGKWPRWTKALITAGWAAVVITGIVVMIVTPWSYDTGSVEIVNLVNNKRMLAPLPPEDLPEMAELLINASQTSSLISEPTPTPVPTRVYCNDNGKYYHLEGCRYVYSTTPRVTLTQAKNAGKTACPYCKPPKEETYNN